MVEPKDEVCLDLQKTFAKFYNQSYLGNQGERKGDGAWNLGKCYTRSLEMRNTGWEIQDTSVDGETQTVNSPTDQC